MRSLLIIIFSLILLGCQQDNTDSKYHIDVASNGVAYKLNSETGDVWVITPTEMQKLQENNNVNLKVGLFYKTEKGNTLKYLGKSQFEKAMTADEFLEKYKKK